MNYGLIAREDGMHLVRLPEDFDLQMMSDSEFGDLLNNPIHRIPGVNRKMACALIDEIGECFMFKNYDKVYKLLSHESDILLKNLKSEP